jgi:intracellular sulfur oxidation DsrE/DsrF family protein
MRRLVYALVGVMMAVPALSHAKAAEQVGVEHAVAPPSVAHPRKVIVQLDSANPKKVQMILNNVDNLVKYYGPGKVKVILDAYGPGLMALLSAKTKFAGRVMTLSTDPNISVVACHTTMKALHKTAKDLVPGVSVVPGGIAEIADRRLAGWIYIAP